MKLTPRNHFLFPNPLRVHDDLYAISKFQLLTDTADMRLDRAHADVDLVSNLDIRHSLRDHLHDLSFTSREALHQHCIEDKKRTLRFILEWMWKRLHWHPLWDSDRSIEGNVHYFR